MFEHIPFKNTQNTNATMVIYSKNNCSLFSVNLMIPDIAVTFIWTFISFMKVRQVIGKGDWLTDNYVQ